MFYCMMDKFFLKDLLEIPAEISFDELNQLFQNLLEQLQIYLDLQPIYDVFRNTS